MGGWSGRVWVDGGLRVEAGGKREGFGRLTFALPCYCSFKNA